QVWVGTAGGLTKLDEQSGKFKPYLTNLSLGGIGCVMEDSGGNLWAATNQGLYKFNKANNDFTFFTDVSGALTASTIIIWITEDHEKNLWLNTSRGIIKLDIEQRTTVVYGKNQGVDANAVTLGFTRENGEILYGSSQGYFAFQPSRLVLNIPAPFVSITNFLLASKRVTPGKGRVLLQTLPQ